MQQFKPDGYNSLSPYFIVDNAQKLIDLLTVIFNAKSLRRFDQPGGGIMHAEVQIDDSVIMISDATAQYPAIKLVLHVYVPDVDDVFRKAVNAGCEPIKEPQEKEGDPDRRGTFRDFAGNLWSIGTQQP